MVDDSDFNFWPIHYYAKDIQLDSQLLKKVMPNFTCLAKASEKKKSTRQKLSHNLSRSDKLSDFELNVVHCKSNQELGQSNYSKLMHSYMSQI